MPAVEIEALARPPEAVDHAAEIIAGLYRCLRLGFGRLGGDAARGLEALARVFAGSPLGPA